MVLGKSVPTCRVIAPRATLSTLSTTKLLLPHCSDPRKTKRPIRPLLLAASSSRCVSSGDVNRTTTRDPEVASNFYNIQEVLQPVCMHACVFVHMHVRECGLCVVFVCVCSKIMKTGLTLVWCSYLIDSGEGKCFAAICAYLTTD